MIVGVSPVEHVVYSTQFGCSVCIKKAKRKGEERKGERKDGSYEKKSTILLYFRYQYDLRLNKVVKCPKCEEPSFGPKNHKEKAVVRIFLQDESKQNEMENLTVVVFES